MVEVLKESEKVTKAVDAQEVEKRKRRWNKLIGWGIGITTVAGLVLVLAQPWLSGLAGSILARTVIGTGVATGAAAIYRATQGARKR